VHIVAPIVAPRITVTSAKFVFDSTKLGETPRPPADIAAPIRRLIDEAVRHQHVAPASTALSNVPVVGGC